MKVEFVSVYPGMGGVFTHREDLAAKLSEGWEIVACAFAPDEGSIQSRIIYTLVKRGDKADAAQPVMDQ